MSKNLHKHYATLGLKPDASIEEVNQTLREKTAKYHPVKYNSISDIETIHALYEAFPAIVDALKENQNLKSIEPVTYHAESANEIHELEHIEPSGTNNKHRLLT